MNSFLPTEVSSFERFSAEFFFRYGVNVHPVHPPPPLRTRLHFANHKFLLDLFLRRAKCNVFVELMRQNLTE